jgi:hypothetical protein
MTWIKFLNEHFLAIWWLIIILAAFFCVSFERHGKEK